MKLNTVIKNVTVIRPDVPGFPDGEALDLGIVGGRFARIEADIPKQMATRSSTARTAGLPGRCRRPSALGHIQLIERGRDNESRAGAQVDHNRPYVHANGTVLPQPCGPYSEFFHRSLNSQRAARYRLRVPPRPDDA